MTERTFVVTIRDDENRSGKSVALAFTESQIRQSERLTHALEQLLVIEENVAAGILPHGNRSVPLKVGDVVRLKSGGPQMTVQRIGESVECSWFAGQEASRGTFTRSALIAA